MSLYDSSLRLVFSIATGLLINHLCKVPSHNTYNDVNDEVCMWETSLQALKGSMVSDVETNLINLRENNDVHLNADMLQRTREVRDLHERLGHRSNDVVKVMLDHSTSPDIRVTSRDVNNAERWLGPCTACLEGKMIAREQALVWGGPDATEVGDVVCLDLIQGDEISLGGNTQLLIGRGVLGGYGFY